VEVAVAVEELLAVVVEQEDIVITVATPLSFPIKDILWLLAAAVVVVTVLATPEFPVTTAVTVQRLA
jgi:hypothetical protein